MNRLDYLKAWQKAKTLNEEISRVFILCEDTSFKILTKRASISVIDNITEAFEQKNTKEIAFFLYMAKNSCAAIYSTLILSKDLSFMLNEIDILLKMTIDVLMSILDLLEMIKL